MMLLSFVCTFGFCLFHVVSVWQTEELQAVKRRSEEEENVWKNKLSEAEQQKEKVSVIYHINKLVELN